MSSAKTVLVTGASGFVGFHTVKVLLDRGYKVVGTVRSESKAKYIREKLGSDRLDFAIVEDQSAPGAFDNVFNDTKFDAVLHTSSPFTYDVKDIEKELYGPAIDGTVGLLKSVKEFAPSVKQVVVTSSMASVMDTLKGDNPGYIYSEKDWNPMTREQGFENGAFGYIASKKFAEKAAWDFMETEKPHFTLTVICPPWIFGPPEQEVSSLKSLNDSAAHLYKPFNGGELEFGIWLWCDVRDVALAHALALESPAAANQRYLCAAGSYSPELCAQYIWKHYPERAEKKNITKGRGYAYPPEGNYGVDNSKSKKDLGIEYIDFDTMLRDTYAKFEELEKQGL